MGPVVIDFETVGIEPRPIYPPAPVGVAIKYPGSQPTYYAWGHPGHLPGNNCTKDIAKMHLDMAWEYAQKHGALFHNAKFDLEVARVHFGLEPPAIIHDTMIALFLTDPHQPDLHLKSSAERLLGLPPEERDEVRDWLILNQPIPEVHIGDGKSSKHPWGAYIAYAPADLVGKYACGDVVRTEALWGLLKNGMNGAYDREIKLLRVLLEIEPQGVRVDTAALTQDVEVFKGVQAKIEAWLSDRLECSPEINWDSGSQLVTALDNGGCLDRKKLLRAEKGGESTSKASLQGAVTNPTVLAMLKYRAQVCTCLRTFMEPWLAIAEISGGRIFTTWHQTRGIDGGTRTGRLSSSPNFQNIPNQFSPIWHHEDPEKGLPYAPFPMPALPNVRKYILPEEGHVLLDRDYSQQELRLLAHYGDGETLRWYVNDPWVDFHELARRLISMVTGVMYPRKYIKTMGFGLLYGMGIKKLAASLGIGDEEAAALRKAYLSVFPDVKTLVEDLKNRGRNNLPIKTWGGRPYLSEPPKRDENGVVVQTYEYKLLNILIQGSAADVTKEAIVKYYDRIKGTGHRLLLTVHDEILVSVPKDEVENGMDILREAMESLPMDVPMLSEGKTGENWATMKDYDKKGVRVE